MPYKRTSPYRRGLWSGGPLYSQRGYRIKVLRSIKLSRDRTLLGLSGTPRWRLKWSREHEGLKEQFEKAIVWMRFERIQRWIYCLASGGVVSRAIVAEVAEKGWENGIGAWPDQLFRGGRCQKRNVVWRARVRYFRSQRFVKRRSKRGENWGKHLKCDCLL